MKKAVLFNVIFFGLWVIAGCSPYYEVDSPLPLTIEKVEILQLCNRQLTMVQLFISPNPKEEAPSTKQQTIFEINPDNKLLEFIKKIHRGEKIHLKAKILVDNFKTNYKIYEIIILSTGEKYTR
jgi:hypothetical protein